MTGRLALLLGTSLVASLFFWAQRCALPNRLETRLCG